MIKDPQYSGATYNPHYETEVRMSIFTPNHDFREGDFLIRAGYEQNRINKKWTNATVEAYVLLEDGDVLKWRFIGRDMYIYGSDSKSDGLKGVKWSGVGDLRVSDIELINNSKP